MPTIYNPNKRKGLFYIPSGAIKSESAAFSYSQDSYRVDESNPTPTITGDTGGTFTATPEGLTLNSSTGEITLSSSVVSSYVVTYTLPSGTFENRSLGITAAAFASTQSFEFDGVDDYFDTGISNLTGTDFSISYWFKTTATLSAFNYYVPFSAVTNYQFTGAYLYFLGTLTVGSRNSTGTFVRGTTNLSNGNWHHIVVTYDISSYSLKMYVDGSIDYDETIGSINSFNQPLRLGGKSSSQFLINCSIDEAAYWNSQLSSTAITEIYNSGVPNNLDSLSNASSPTAWYRMGE